MKTRAFLSLLGVIALVAVIYSPSSLGVSAGGDGGTGPSDTSASGTSMFVASLRQEGYHVIIANDTSATLNSLRGQSFAYLLIGADTVLSSQQVTNITSGYQAGKVSLLIAEGNKTNLALIEKLGATVSGAAILDPTSTFKDQRVFTVTPSLSPEATGVIDIASPIRFIKVPSLNPLRSVAETSAYSVDAANTTLGPRTVIATGAQGSAHLLLISDSAGFTNGFFNYTSGQVDEKSFVDTMVTWVAPSKATTVVFDASHYAAPASPRLQMGVPIGPLVALVLEQQLSSLNSYYSSFPSQVSGFLQGFGINVSDSFAVAIFAVILLLSVYAAVTRWFAPEKKGKDDQPVPSVERTIVAESRARLDFLQSSRTKSFYAATMGQLYEVLGSIIAEEFGKDVSSVTEAQLSARIGPEGARRAMDLLVRLSTLYAYAIGKKRFLFPPVLRWRALASRMTRESEWLLNQLGITMAGEEPSKQKVEYVMRERAR
jgi:hypothetical protein